MGQEESYRVDPQDLRWICDPASLPFRTSDECAVLEETVGQDRALRAIEMGLEIAEAGYNLYVAGIPGTGRNTTLRAQLKRLAQGRPLPKDWCYVYNFSDPSRPTALVLPPGKGREFAADMDTFIQACKQEIAKSFDSEGYSQRREELAHHAQQQRNSLTSRLEEEAGRRGFAIAASPVGPMPVPLREGQPLTREAFEQLPAEERQQVEAGEEELRLLIAQVANQVRRLERALRESEALLNRDVTQAAIGPLLEELHEKYEGQERLVAHLDTVGEDIIANLGAFRAGEGEAPALPLPVAVQTPPEDFFRRYEVNVIVTHSGNNGAPVVFENSPTYYNLFGRVDYRAQVGAMVTDHTMIRPGALHMANGGFLVVQAPDLFSSPSAWETLKRTLRSREIRVENIGEQYRVIPSTTLAPEPIPLDAKVVIIGNPLIYHLALQSDEDFRKLFKVKADFAVDIERSPETIQHYGCFIATRCRDGGYRSFDASAVAKVIEHGARLAGHRERLSTRFIDIADLITEAEYWAKRDGDAPLVSAAHVQRAIDEKTYRSNLVQERLQQLISEGTLRIATEGEVVGQVNGVAVYELGDYNFGKPSRITARVSLGRGQVINVEREIEMSGRLHSKGFLALTGYLTGRYGTDKQLSFSASIGFEQTYDEVEGDSASSAELYALLSAIAGIPLKQGIAVTGSVNQRGEVQAVGGVVEKVEGFYAVCKARGLDGTHGVIIPRDNVKNLMLREEVVEAARQGLFHVYAVDTVDQGLAILTGLPAGAADAEGRYDPNSVNGRVEAALRQMAERYKELTAEKEKEKEATGRGRRRAAGQEHERRPHTTRAASERGTR